MRVKISVNKMPYSGYENIDPDPIFYEDLGCTPKSIRNIEILDDRECDEIILDECLSYIPHQELGNYLHSVTKKIKRGGKLTIVESDAKKIVFDYYYGSLTEEVFNYKFFGNQSRPSLFKTSCLSLALLKDFISQNYKISKIHTTDEYTFVMEIIIE